MPGQFEMTPELMDQIIFGMENQREDLILDSREGVLVPREEPPEEEDGDFYFELPLWTPSDGFRLMEGFATSLKNPIYRERLRQILGGGRGVFRGFKNVLKERPDLERMWFLYKERLMKQRVKEWYGELCGYWDARDAGAEPSETEDLFQEEFSLRSGDGAEEEVRELRRAFFEEVYRDLPEELRRLFIRQQEWRGRPADFVLKAYTPEGSCSGLLTGFVEGSEKALLLQADCLYVLPEYRGAGIASGLIERAGELCYERGIDRFLLDLPSRGELLSENLKRKGFKPFRRTLELAVPHWYYETARS